MSTEVNLRPIVGIPLARPGDDPGALIGDAVHRSAASLRAGDVVVVASKLVSRCEGRFVRRADVVPSARAAALAELTGKDPHHIEVVLSETAAVSRAAPGVLIVRHRLGYVVANAGVDASNVLQDGEWLLLPADPNAAAAAIRDTLAERFEPGIAVVISDSFGRPFRHGTVGVAIGSAGMAVLRDLRGRPDLNGRLLEHTSTAVADGIAAAADLVMGQADDAIPAVIVSNLTFSPSDVGAGSLCRDPASDLFA